MKVANAECVDAYASVCTGKLEGCQILDGGELASPFMIRVRGKQGCRNFKVCNGERWFRKRAGPSSLSLGPVCGELEHSYS